MNPLLLASPPKPHRSRRGRELLACPAVAYPRALLTPALEGRRTGAFSGTGPGPAAVDDTAGSAVMPERHSPDRSRPRGAGAGTDAVPAGRVAPGAAYRSGPARHRLAILRLAPMGTSIQHPHTAYAHAMLPPCSSSSC